MKRIIMRDPLEMESLTGRAEKREAKKRQSMKVSGRNIKRLAHFIAKKAREGT